MPPQPEPDLVHEIVPNTKARYDYVVEVYNTIAFTIRKINEHTEQFQTTKNTMVHQFDSLLITEFQKQRMRAQSPSFVGISKLLAQNTAHILVLEEWEKDFRSEWKQKKESLMQRHVWVEKRPESLKRHKGSLGQRLRSHSKMRELRMSDPKQARHNKEGKRTVEHEGVDEEVLCGKGAGAKEADEQMYEEPQEQQG
jgi:hypothetical protein